MDVYKYVCICVCTCRLMCGSAHPSSTRRSSPLCIQVPGRVYALAEIPPHVVFPYQYEQLQYLVASVPRSEADPRQVSFTVISLDVAESHFFSHPTLGTYPDTPISIFFPVASVLFLFCTSCVFAPNLPKCHLSKRMWRSCKVVWWCGALDMDCVAPFP